MKARAERRSYRDSSSVASHCQLRCMQLEGEESRSYGRLATCGFLRACRNEGHGSLSFLTNAAPCHIVGGARASAAVTRRGFAMSRQLRWTDSARA
jgi:hypothetical protein